MDYAISTQEARTSHRKLSAALWTTQGTLALIFLFAGVMKLVLPIEIMTDQIPLPGAFLRFIGVCETLGAIGLILPGVTRIRTGLTPLAATGLVFIMIGAVGTTLAFADASSCVVPAVVGALAAFVAYGRRKIAPLSGSPRFSVLKGVGQMTAGEAAA